MSNEIVLPVNFDKKYDNGNISGIFPYGCTICIDSTGKQPCQTPAAKPNTHNICLIQRVATSSGGMVVINYIKKTDKEFNQ